MVVGDNVRHTSSSLSASNPRDSPDLSRDRRQRVVDLRLRVVQSSGEGVGVGLELADGEGAPVSGGLSRISYQHELAGRSGLVHGQRMAVEPGRDDLRVNDLSQFVR